MGSGNILVNRAEERESQLKEAKNLLRSEYGITIEDSAGIILATSFRNPIPFAFVPVDGAKSPSRVRIDAGSLSVNTKDLSDFLGDECHSATIKGIPYYVVNLSGGIPPTFLEIAFLEYAPDYEGKAASIKVIANKATIIKEAGGGGKRITGYAGESEVPLRVVAMRREFFARIKVNEQLRSLFEEVMD